MRVPFVAANLPPSTCIHASCLSASSLRRLMSSTPVVANRPVLTSPALTATMLATPSLCSSRSTASRSSRQGWSLLYGSSLTLALPNPTTLAALYSELWPRLVSTCTSRTPTAAQAPSRPISATPPPPFVPAPFRSRRRLSTASLPHARPSTLLAVAPVVRVRPGQSPSPAPRSSSEISMRSAASSTKPEADCAGRWPPQFWSRALTTLSAASAAVSVPPVTKP